MTHMQPEIRNGRWLVVETVDGTYTIPDDVVAVDPTQSLVERAAALQPFVEGRIEGRKDWAYFLADGWGVRMSAPGYMDATEWLGPFDTRTEAESELRSVDEGYFFEDVATDELMKQRNVIYEGDVNVEHGGVFYTLDDFEHGYVSAVRVQARDDLEGDAKLETVIDVDTITVLVDNPALSEALKECGLEGDRLTFGDAAASEDIDAQRKIAAACILYGLYEPDEQNDDHRWSRTVQLGFYQHELTKDDDHVDANWQIDTLYAFVLKKLGRGELRGCG